MNGGWYPRPAAQDKVKFILAWQHIVGLFRANAPGAKIVFNLAIGMQQVYPDQIYPRDAYVDVIAVDAYNTSYDAGVVANNVAVEPKMWTAVSDSWASPSDRLSQGAWQALRLS